MTLNFTVAIAEVDKEIEKLQRVRLVLLEYQQPIAEVLKEKAQTWATPAPKKRGITPQGIENIKAAQRARWARYKREQRRLARG